MRVVVIHAIFIPHETNSEMTRSVQYHTQIIRAASCARAYSHARTSAGAVPPSPHTSYRVVEGGGQPGGLGAGAAQPHVEPAVLKESRPPAVLAVREGGGELVRREGKGSCVRE